MASRKIEVKVPDIGDFTDVPVIEVLVEAGEQVEAEQSLVTLESDKATMEVPTPVSGKVVSVEVDLNAEVSEGDLIAVIEADDGQEQQHPEDEGNGRDEQTAESRAGPDAGEEDRAEQDNGDDGQPHAGGGGEEGGVVADSAAEEAAAAAVAAGGGVHTVPGRREERQHAVPKGDFDFDVLVLGSGPGGYTAAFRAADLGLKVALVERYPTLGGVCLNVGCIPSKALLHAAAVIEEAAQLSDHGIEFGKPEIDIERLRAWKDRVVGRLTTGLDDMAGKREVKVIQGTGLFASPNEMEIETDDGNRRISFAQSIIAAGSQSTRLPDLPWDDPRVMDSTDALGLEEIPDRLLVIGGGIIGLEMASVYLALGSRVTVIELTGQLMPGTDPDLVRPLYKRLAGRCEGIHVNTRVSALEAGSEGLRAEFEGGEAPEAKTFDRVLVSVGRTPNGAHIGAAAAGVEVTERGFIPVDRRMRTNVRHIFAIGDIVGHPMLAHKATHEGKVAAEVCAGRKSAFDARVIPSVAYTDPEVAWAGLTEEQARDANVEYGVGKFPWSASGRALGIGRPEGFTKLLFDPSTKRLVGAGIVGTHAGDLISECALAIEMGAEAADIGLTIHPHPTLSESVAMAAEVFEGTVTDLYLPKRK